MSQTSIDLPTDGKLHSGKTYQAKTVLGIMKMAQVATRKMVTVDLVSMFIKCIWRLALQRGSRILTGRSLGEVSTCPKLNEDIEESGLGCNDGGPTFPRVNCRLKKVIERLLPSHSATPAPKAKAGSTHRSA